MVVAVTALSALAIPNEEFSAPFRLLKFGFIFLGGTLGMFGILLGLYMLLSHIAELKSFGVPERKERDTEEKKMESGCFRQDFGQDARCMQKKVRKLSLE